MQLCVYFLANDTNDDPLSCIRFDDIFLGIVAMKAGIEPLHSEEFYFHKAPYLGPQSYKYVLATHGYDEPTELTKVWNEIRASGYA